MKHTTVSRPIFKVFSIILLVSMLLSRGRLAAPTSVRAQKAVGQGQLV
jgi:hypothetical protein